MRSLVSFIIVVLAIATPAAGQCWLTTTFAYNGGQSGNIFDVVALNPVTITGFDVNLDAGTWTVEVYTCFFGSYVGYDHNPLAWTLVGSGTVGANGPGVPTSLPFALSVPIAAGATQGFYVTTTIGTPINYTSGTLEGAVYTADANIQVLEGLGMGYPFGFSFTPRVWNGTVYYTGGTTGYQVNQPASSLTVSGAADLGPCRDMVFTFQATNPFSLDLNSTLSGNPFDLAYTPGTGTVALSAGGIQLIDGQVINLDLNAVQLLFAPSVPPVVGPFSIYLTAPAVPAPVTVGLQQVVLDPTSMIGFWLSRAVEINFN